MSCNGVRVCGNVDNGDRVHNSGVAWGFVVGQGSNRAYVNEKVNWFDHYEMDSWSPIWPKDFDYELNYSKNLALKVY